MPGERTAPTSPTTQRICVVLLRDRHSASVGAAVGGGGFEGEVAGGAGVGVAVR